MSTAPADATAFILHWLLSGPQYALEEALARSRHAMADREPGDRESYLRELECWVGYHWNYGPHEAVSEHTRRLREGLTDEQIEQADWPLIAEALVNETTEKR